MVKRKYLFIEGTRDTNNGDLREGFCKLFEKQIKGKMPTISMGEGKKQAIDKFLNSSDSLLLCDLDAPSSEINMDLINNQLSSKKDSVFYTNSIIKTDQIYFLFLLVSNENRIIFAYVKSNYISYKGEYPRDKEAHKNK